jgi:LmbE family N-acetylglucosaminyl deacetylase
MSVRSEADSPFEGDLLVCAPHMDDETLGCGMLIARHAAHHRVQVLFATNGARSPEPPADQPQAAAGLPAVREAEAVQALEILGVPRSNIEFLGLPDGALRQHQAELGRLVAERVQRSSIAHVLVPFRYDRHPDHLALNRSVTAEQAGGQLGASVVEYFVYTQWRLLGSGDVRDYVKPADLVRLRSEEAAERKRRALACYRSQTTRYFEGQRRAILTATLLERVCAEPEAFLHHRPDRSGRRGLGRGRYWVPLACRLEPALKRWKDRLTGELVQ